MVYLPYGIIRSYWPYVLQSQSVLRMKSEMHSDEVTGTLDSIDRRLNHIERLLEDFVGRIEPIEEALESGGLKLVDFREEPTGWEAVFRTIREFQMELFLIDIPFHLDHLPTTASTQRINDYARDVAEGWDRDRVRYQIRSIPRQELKKRVGISDKTLKKITDFLVARGDILRYGRRGGDMDGRIVRFALHPRGLIVPIRSVLITETRRRYTGTDNLTDDELMKTPRPI